MQAKSTELQAFRVISSDFVIKKVKESLDYDEMNFDFFGTKTGFTYLYPSGIFFVTMSASSSNPGPAVHAPVPWKTELNPALLQRRPAVQCV